MSTAIQERNAARALLLNQYQQVLLMKIIEPSTGKSFWLTPGGGVEEGEEVEASLQRELFEETGLRQCIIGAHVWNRAHQFTWEGISYFQRERYFLVNVEHFDPVSIHQVDGVERDSFGGFRWWTVEEVAHSDELFVPRRLAQLLQQLIHQGPPTNAIDVGA